MYSQLLDQKTFAAVVSAAPVNWYGDYRHLGRLVLAQLEALQTVKPGYSENGETVWHAPLSEIAEMIDFKPTPNRIGRVCGMMGLVKAKFRDGYHVFWNARQLNLLRSAMK